MGGVPGRFEQCYNAQAVVTADSLLVVVAQTGVPSLEQAKLQSDRLLANLVNIPAAVITAEASYHAVYDHCTAKYLAQAWVKVTALSLGDQGVHGNAHMIMLEKNNLQVAAVIARWLARTVPAR